MYSPSFVQAVQTASKKDHRQPYQNTFGEATKVDWHGFRHCCTTTNALLQLITLDDASPDTKLASSRLLGLHLRLMLLFRLMFVPGL